MEICCLIFVKQTSCIGDDKGIGRLTCRNSSTVDYCISSPYFF